MTAPKKLSISENDLKKQTNREREREGGGRVGERERERERERTNRERENKQREREREREISLFFNGFHREITLLESFLLRVTLLESATFTRLA